MLKAVKKTNEQEQFTASCSRCFHNGPCYIRRFYTKWVTEHGDFFDFYMKARAESRIADLKAFLAAHCELYTVVGINEMKFQPPNDHDCNKCAHPWHCQLSLELNNFEIPSSKENFFLNSISDKREKQLDFKAGLTKFFASYCVFYVKV